MKTHPLYAAHADLIERTTTGLSEGGTDHAHARALRSTLVREHVALDSLMKMATHRDPTMTPAAQDKLLIASAKKLDQSIARTRENLQEATRDGLREIQARINQKINLTPHPLAAEIRVKVSSMTTAERATLMTKLIDNNDGPLLGAILNAPAILTGINEEMQQRYTQALTAKHAPAELEEQQYLTAAFSTALLATDTAKAIAESFSDPAKLASIEAGEKSAADAAAAFLNATAN